MEQNESNYLRAIVALVSNKWTLPVVHCLHHGTKRYGEISRVLPDITQKVLTETLHKLERDGLVKRTFHPSIPPKVEYELTELGSSLRYVTGSLVEWAELHIDEVRHAQVAYDTVKLND